ncbi:MAG: WD40/YVTN/BNR-like repeat-containing protein, partial [Vulcanimicrobiaceae bacterium]
MLAIAYVVPASVALAVTTHAPPAARIAMAATVSAHPGATPTPSPSPEPSPSPPYNRLEFRSIGPAVAGGRVAAVAGSASDPMLYYVGAADGGVWKTVDGGAFWSPVFDKESTQSIGALAVDPTNPEVVWVGTGESNPRNDVTSGDGVYKSSDGGKTWMRVGLEDTLQISAISIDPRDPDEVVVAAMGDFFADSQARGIYRTSDGGKTWTHVLFAGPQSGGSDLARDPRDPRVLYAGIWQFRRVPWNFTSGGPDDGIYKSSDGGASWTKLAGNGLPNEMGRIGLAIAPSDPRRVYAVIEAKDGVLWRSDDAGAHWTMVSNDTLVDQRPFYFSHIAVDPKNPDRVYAASEMLALSSDGGKRFKSIADHVHVDYHAIWIAPNDPKRIIVGEDGGYAITLDGEHWAFSANLPIGQVYHVGFDDETPYRVCAALQDNNAYCGPSNALDPEGIPNAAWEGVVGGDGVWAVPDPNDPEQVWTDAEDGALFVYDRRAERSRFAAPWIANSLESFDLSRARYRFNWDAPIAFSPWDPKVAWFGANVVFATSDGGTSWHPISPDLSYDVKAHQGPAGGPIRFDVSGAEYSDTLLDIEASPRRRGEIWTGADDGRIERTLDGGAHWKDVTPLGVPPWGRVETVAPSPLVDGTAYATIDRHRSGDRQPYVFVTRDFGRTWTSIANGLPSDQQARTIRPDPRDSHLLYLGLERSLWLSYDDGAHWRRFDRGIPAVSIRDLRVQPRFDDLIVATHGRDLWIFDDLAGIRELPLAESRGTMLFPLRTAYL